MQNTKEERIKNFMQEYGELVKKHNVDFASYPIFTPTEDGSWSIKIQSMPVDMEEYKKEDFIAKNETDKKN